jgi:hypothetical protein
LSHYRRILSRLVGLDDRRTDRMCFSSALVSRTTETYSTSKTDFRPSRKLIAMWQGHLEGRSNVAYMASTRRLDPDGINAAFDVAPTISFASAGGTFRGGSAVGVHFKTLERDFSGDPKLDRFSGLTERFCRLWGGGESVAGRLAESRCKSIARSTLPSARMRTSNSDSGDALVNIDDRMASLVSVSSSPSVPSFPMFSVEFRGSALDARPRR